MSLWSGFLLRMSFEDKGSGSVAEERVQVLLALWDWDAANPFCRGVIMVCT